MHGVFSRSMVRALLSKSLNRISSKVSSLVQSVTRPLTPFIQLWRTHTSHPIVLNVIRHGHEIPFLTGPPTFNGVMNSITADPAEMLVLRQELDDMLAKGAVARFPDYLAQEG